MYTGYQTNGFLNEFLKATHPTTHQRLRQSTLAVLLIEEGIKPKEEVDGVSRCAAHTDKNRYAIDFSGIAYRRFLLRFLTLPDRY